MKSMMRKCNNCSLYTLKDSCPKCGLITIMPVPARYSPQDNYGEYRRRLKKLSEEPQNSSGDRK
jgi:H/ACA ribonucleoprotein complex subunit 3